MKHLKIYEEYDESDIKIGYYVVLNIVDTFFIGLSSMRRMRAKEYLNNTIGEIVNIFENYSGNIQIEVKYNNYPYDISDIFSSDKTIIAHKSDIIDISESKNDLVDRYNLRQEANKFNI